MLIIREDESEITMIEQDLHAHISAKLIQNWKAVFFKDDPNYSSVLFAIKHHDCGWRFFDQQPFWNDMKQLPYTFTDFPVLPKVALYTKGVDEVEKENPYAAALCSAHYSKFLSKNSSDVAKKYIEEEKVRRKHIFSTMNFGDLNKHLSILQFADNLSLYICLNEPGVGKENEHYFFKEGIPISQTINGVNTDMVEGHWKDTKTVVLKGLPYVVPFSVKVPQKRLDKKTIADNGLLKSYESAPYEHVHIEFIVQ